MTEIIDVPDARSNADLRSEVNSLRQAVKQLASLAGILRERLGRMEDAHGVGGSHRASYPVDYLCGEPGQCIHCEDACVMTGQWHRARMLCAEPDNCIHCTPDAQ